ncbi:MAG: hypothetical protein DIU52_013815 [bacterium]|nr:MAG: hypothetical protein DIU52_14865 [bacterium]
MLITAVPEARAAESWGIFFVQDAECHYVCVDPAFGCCVHDPLPPIIVNADDPPSIGSLDAEGSNPCVTPAGCASACSAPEARCSMSAAGRVPTE